MEGYSISTPPLPLTCIHGIVIFHMSAQPLLFAHHSMPQGMSQATHGKLRLHTGEWKMRANECAGHCASKIRGEYSEIFTAAATILSRGGWHGKPLMWTDCIAHLSVCVRAKNH